MPAQARVDYMQNQLDLCSRRANYPIEAVPKSTTPTIGSSVSQEPSKREQDWCAAVHQRVAEGPAGVLREDFLRRMDFQAADHGLRGSACAVRNPTKLQGTQGLSTTHPPCTYQRCLVPKALLDGSLPLLSSMRCGFSRPQAKTPWRKRTTPWPTLKLIDLAAPLNTKIQGLPATFQALGSGPKPRRG